MEVSGKVNNTVDAGSVVDASNDEEPGYHCEPCKHDKKNTRASGFCKECEEYMCQRCFDNHRSARLCRHHEMSNEMSAAKLGGTKKECAYHKGETIKFYCRKDDVVGCGDCMVQNHNDCRPEFIRDVSVGFHESEEFIILKEKVEHLSEIHKMLEEVAMSRRNENKLMLQKALEEIESFRTVINLYLDIIQARVISEAERIMSDNEEKLDKLEENCKEHTPELKTLTQLLNTDVFEDNKLFINAVENKPNISEIDQKIEQLQSIPMDIFEFVKDKQLRDIVTVTEKLGTLSVSRGSLTGERSKYINEEHEGRHNATPNDSRIKANDNKLMVVAINLQGNSACLTYSFVHKFESDPTEVSYKIWSGTYTARVTVPFCLLVHPGGNTIEAFGYEATYKYADMVESGEHNKYYYFDNITDLVTGIVTQNSDEGVLLPDKTGRSLPALAVLSMGIQYMKNDLIAYLNKASCGLKERDDIYFVLSVPAYLEDTFAMALLKKAAITAGIQPDSLTVVSDIDAASIFYQYARPDLFSDQRGMKFILINTTDTSTQRAVHEIGQHGELREILKPYSIAAGSSSIVLSAFEDYLVKIVGKDILENFKSSHRVEYIDFVREILVMIRNFSPKGDANSLISFRIPGNLEKSSIEKSRIKGNDVNMTADKMRIKATVFQSFVEQAIKAIIGEVRLVLQCLPDVKVILMSGEFSRSPFLLKTVKETFPDIQVVDAEMVAPRGAVITGHAQKFIKKIM